MSKVLVAMDKSGSFRLYMTETTDMCLEAARIHDTSPVATAALGRVLTGTALMSTMLKEPENRLTVQFKGEGPIGQIIACADGEGNVKGYAGNPYVDLPLKEGKLDVGGSLGIGELTVIRDIGLKEPYSGTIALVSGEIAEDLTAYYFISEQQNTSVALGVKVDREKTVDIGAGFIVQMIPGAEEGAISALENILGDMEPVTAIAEKARERVSDTEDSFNEAVLRKMMKIAFGDLPAEYALSELEMREARWNCDCSRERMAGALATIGTDSLKEIMDEDGEAELVCHFCNTEYKFGYDELKDIYDGITKGE